VKSKLSAIFLGVIFAVQMSAREYSARVTLHVVDDEGQAITGAKTIISFVREYARAESERVGSSRGISDAKGLATLDGKTMEASIGYGAEKDGYYQVMGARFFFTSTGYLRLLPWNPTIEVVLKRIKKPVPMYAKRVASSLPQLEAPVSYDLEAGDWVSPYGRGKTADLVFVGKLNKNGDRVYDWTMKLTFSNPRDGIQRFKPEPDFMRFQSPHEAPEDGYVSEWNLARTRRGPKVREQTNYDVAGGYFFRVRTVLDKDGKVVKALYGKIYGDFFDMVYYLNPDGTRNIEYDPKRNLLQTSNSDDSAYKSLAP